MDFLARLFSSVGFMPRMRCGLWTDELVVLHTVSDAVIWLSYMLIPYTMVYALVLYQQDRFNVEKAQTYAKRLVWLYFFFILLCGLTHLDNIIVFWYPAYRFFGLVSLLTAVASGGTVLSLAWVISLCSRPKVSDTKE